MAKAIDRHLARIRDESAGAFALLAERDHPLVRILSAHTYRGFRRWTVLCVAVPILAAVAVALVGYLPNAWDPEGQGYLSGPQGDLLRWTISGVTILLVGWPAVCIIGAGLSTATAVAGECAGDRAIQLVLTPLPKRPIAASKILPFAWPFLWGIVAMLPLYCLVGGSRLYFLKEPHDCFMLPSATWPVRAFSLFFLEETRLRPGAVGVVIGLVMATTDAGLVWAAAHWGAGLAVRWKGSLPAVILALGLRLAGAAGAGCGFWFLTLMGIFWLQLPGPFRFIPVALHASALLALWYVWPVRGAVRRALAEFAFFDRLADDEPMPSRQRRFAGRRWWEVNWRQ